MSDRIGIGLRAVLSAEQKDIEQQIRQLSGQIKERLELKLKINVSDLQLVNNEINRFQKDIEGKLTPIDFKVDTSRMVSDIDKISQKYVEMSGGAKALTQETKEYVNNANQSVKIVEDINAKTEEVAKTTTTVTENYKNQRIEQERVAKEQERILQYEQKIRLALSKIQEKETSQLDQQQSKDWAGRRKEAVDSLTMKNTELEKMRQYYSEQERISAASHKQKQAELDKNRVIKERLVIFQKELSLRSQALTGRYGESVNVEALKKVNEEVSKLTTETFTPEAKSRVNTMFKEVEVGAKNSASQLKNVAHDGYSFIEMISLAAKKIAIWGISTTLIYNNLRKLREGLTFLKDLDKDLTEVSMITGMTREQTRGLALEYANLGREMGKTVQEISAVNKELLRQGLSMDVAKERMDSIIKLSATARISADESLKIITSSVNAMGETAEKTSDVLLKAGMTSASSASQIGEAFTKTASSARATGMTIEETASILATMIEVTQESPSSLGNSMKTLLARFNKVNEETGELNEELNLVQRAFESVNVKFLDSAGQIRNVGGLLSDLNEKWGTLDKNTKMYIATQAAGKIMLA